MTESSLEDTNQSSRSSRARSGQSATGRSHRRAETSARSSSGRRRTRNTGLEEIAGLAQKLSEQNQEQPASSSSFSDAPHGSNASTGSGSSRSVGSGSTQPTRTEHGQSSSSAPKPPVMEPVIAKALSEEPPTKVSSASATASGRTAAAESSKRVLVNNEASTRATTSPQLRRKRIHRSVRSVPSEANTMLTPEQLAETRRELYRTKQPSEEDMAQYRDPSNYVNSARAQRSTSSAREFIDQDRYLMPNNGNVAHAKHAAPGRENASLYGESSRPNVYEPMGVSLSPRNKRSRKKRVITIVAVLLVLLGIGGIIGYNAWQLYAPVTVTINDNERVVSGTTRTVDGVINGGMVVVQPGDYIAVDGTVMREGDGNIADVTINGESVELGTRMYEGDVIVISDGSDIMEPHTDSDEKTLPHGFKTEGYGALHVYTVAGEDGTKATRTGEESGITVDITTKEPVDGVLTYYNANTKGDKVICLTIDDGPWDQYTTKLLDILEKNKAKATFYTVGENIQGREDLLKRAASLGCEIATHTYDHAAGSGQGVNLNYMTKDEQIKDVTKGLKAIEDAGITPSVYMRSPGGNFDEKTAQNLQDLIQGEIGWNIDTEDWKRPGADSIAFAIKRVAPGEVILCHDGGGDRSQTIAALEDAIPELIRDGYKFITISELIEKYPYQG